MHNAFSESYSDKEKIEVHNMSMNKNIFTFLKKGYHHIIKINNIEFKIDANKVSPFVLLNKKLYYSNELNLNDNNLENSTFTEIDLKNYLKK